VLLTPCVFLKSTTNHHQQQQEEEQQEEQEQQKLYDRRLKKQDRLIRNT